MGKIKQVQDSNEPFAKFVGVELQQLKWIHNNELAVDFLLVEVLIKNMQVVRFNGGFDLQVEFTVGWLFFYDSVK